MYPLAPLANCPVDGTGGIFMAASDNGQKGSFSSITKNQSSYSDVQITAVTVNGVKGVRTSGLQSSGMGSGTAQVEYDFTVGSRTYTFLAYVTVPSYSGYDITAQFDQLVQTVTFG
jgi:hypothetical protein